MEELKLTEEEAALRVANFYNDLSLSGVFVYTGDNEWDLQDRQSVDLWDKDASFFIDPEELKIRKAQRQAEKAALRAAVAEAQAKFSVVFGPLIPVYWANCEWPIFRIWKRYLRSKRPSPSSPLFLACFMAICKPGKQEANMIPVRSL